MNKLSYYDIFGVIAPGVVLLAGLLLALGDLNATALIKEVSIGGLGVFAIAAYPAGQIAQAGGNLLERAYWYFFDGMPTDWARTGNYQRLSLSRAQLSKLSSTYVSKLSLDVEKPLSDLSPSAWKGITDQIYGKLEVAGRASRAETFNSNYGFHRGLTVALLTVAVAALFVGRWGMVVLTLAASAASLYRMHRFGIRFARELFMQFLELPNSEARE